MIEGDSKLWELERIMMGLECTDPWISDARYLTEIKETMIEILGDRLRDDQGRDRLRKHLAQRGYSPEHGFPDNPDGCRRPAEPGGMDDLGSFVRLKETIDRQRNAAVRLRDAEEEARFPKQGRCDNSDILAKEIRLHDEAYARRNAGG